MLNTSAHLDQVLQDFFRGRFFALDVDGADGDEEIYARYLLKTSDEYGKTVCV